VSTLEAYFQGRKELFDGLAIADLEKDWTEYPVLRLDLSNSSYDSPEVLKSKLSKILNEWEKIYGECETDLDVGTRFGYLIKQAYEKTGKQVVILVDEYDAPLVGLIDKEELLEINRDILSGFYKNIKTYDSCIKFAFLTGVTKFGHMNVFSALNNLNDISLDENYQAICGITEEELHSYFDDGVGEMADKNDISKEECYGRLKTMYDGYHFCSDGVGMYNPFSLLNALNSRRFASYWYQTGTPTILIKSLKNNNVDISAIPGRIVSAERLATVGSYREDVTALLYQSGYLTIASEEEPGYYMLDFPNMEVRNGFYNQLAAGLYHHVGRRCRHEGSAVASGTRTRRHRDFHQ